MLAKFTAYLGRGIAFPRSFLLYMFMRIIYQRISSGSVHMTSTTDTLQYGKNWYQMLNYLAQSEAVVDVYLCSNAYGNSNDIDEMVAETHGVRIIYVGEDFFIVGPRRPIHSSIIPMGWISMIRIHNDETEVEYPSLAGDDESPLSEPVSSIKEE